MSEWTGSRSPNTKYRARITVELPNGTKKRVTGYGRTQKSAILARDAKVRELARENPSGESIRFRELAARFIEKKKLEGRKQKTIYDYERNIEKHITSRIGEYLVIATSTPELQSLVTRLVDAKKYRTAELVRILLVGMLDVAVEDNPEYQNAARGIPRVRTPALAKRKRHYEVWTHEQIMKFLAKAREPYEKNISPYYPAYVLAYFTGLRQGEILNLQWRDLKTRIIKIDGEAAETHFLDVSRQFVWVEGELREDSPKTKAGERHVPIDADLVAFLREHQQRVRKWATSKGWTPNNLVAPSLVGEPIDPSHLRRHMAAVRKAVGLEHMPFHGLRKAYATMLTKSLVESGQYNPKIVQRAMGHSRSDVALEVYTRVIEEDYYTAALTFHNPPKKEK